jgi:type VI protein secretion system component VasA
MKTDLSKVFTSEQHLDEIMTLSNTDIDRYLEAGARVLIGAETALEDGSYEEVGLSRDEVLLDIERINYNLDLFTEAFATKEKFIPLINGDMVMYFHMN